MYSLEKRIRAIKSRHNVTDIAICIQFSCLMEVLFLKSSQTYYARRIDCFDGSVTAWTLGVSPDAALVNGMLDKPIELLRENEHPMIHSDRGCHYRWTGWI